MKKEKTRPEAEKTEPEKEEEKQPDEEIVQEPADSGSAELEKLQEELKGEKDKYLRLCAE